VVYLSSSRGRSIVPLGNYIPSLKLIAPYL
jgi:hypothetical protein